MPLNMLLTLIMRSILGSQVVYTPSTLRIRAVLVCMVLFGASFVVGGAFVWQAGPRVENSLKATLDSGTSSLDGAMALVDSLLAQILPLAASLNSALLALGQPAYDISSLLAPIVTFNSTSTKVINLLDEYRPRINQGLDGIRQGTLALGVVIVAATLAVWGTSAMSYRRSLAASGVLMWLLAILLWLLSGIAYILFLFASDGCSTLDWVIAAPSTSGLVTKVPCFAPTFAPITFSLALQPTYLGVVSLNAALGNCRYDPDLGAPSTPLGAGLLCNPVARGSSGYYSFAPVGSCAANSTALSTAAFLAAYDGSQTFAKTYVANSSVANSTFVSFYDGSYTRVGNGIGFGSYTYTTVACPLISAAPATMQLLADTAQSCAQLLVVAAEAGPLLTCSFVYTPLDTAQAQCVPLKAALSLLTRGGIIAAISACVLLLLAGLLYRHLHPERLRLTAEHLLKQKEEEAMDAAGVDVRGLGRRAPASDVEQGQPGRRPSQRFVAADDGKGIARAGSGAFVVGGSEEDQVRQLEDRLAQARVQALETELVRARGRAARPEDAPSAPPLPNRRW